MYIHCVLVGLDWYQQQICESVTFACTCTSYNVQYVCMHTNVTHSLHAFGLNVVGSKVNVIDIDDLHCHFHASIRIMTDEHLDRGREGGGVWDTCTCLPSPAASPHTICLLLLSCALVAGLICTHTR